MRPPARFLPAAFIAACALGISACGTDAVVDSPLIVSDSAGIEIVQNAEPCWTSSAGWQLSAAPIVTIGALDGGPGQDLFRVTGARRLTDGRIVVTNRGTYELRFFSPDGTYMSAVGGEGEGPGEFSGPMTVFGAPGDSLVVYESGRLSVFDAAGQYARSYSMPSPEVPSLRRVIGLFGDGSMLIGIQPRLLGRYTTTGVESDSTTFYLSNQNGVVVDTLGRFFTNDMFVQILENGLRAQSLPFGRSGTVTVAGETFVYGSTDAYEFRVHSQTGRILRIIRLTREGTPLSRALLDSVRRDRLAAADTDEEVSRAEMMVDAASSYETLPAYAAFNVDLEGNIWVLERRQTDDSVRRWVVFSGEGVCLGTVETPGGVTVYEIGRDYLLGEAVDTMGVERVEMYGLSKGT